MTPAVYATLTDRQIVWVYFAARDEDGVLITRGGSGAGGEGHEGKLDAWQRERIARSSAELPAPEALAIPQEVTSSQVYHTNPHWAVMYWDLWAKRGLTPPQILAKWREEGHGERHF